MGTPQYIPVYCTVLFKTVLYLIAKGGDVAVQKRLLLRVGKTGKKKNSPWRPVLVAMGERSRGQERGAWES